MHAYTYVCVRMYACVYIYVCVYIYIKSYIYIYMNMYIHLLGPQRARQCHAKARFKRAPPSIRTTGAHFLSERAQR